MTVTLHYTGYDKTIIMKSFKFDYDQNGKSVYAELKKHATQLATDIEDVDFSSDCYAGALAEVTYKFHLYQRGLKFLHPGYITHGRRTYDRGDYKVYVRQQEIVFDIKTSQTWENVSYKPRTDVKVHKLIGTHIEYDDNQVTLYVYGTLPTSIAHRCDIKGFHDYYVIPPYAFAPLVKDCVRRPYMLELHKIMKNPGKLYKQKVEALKQKYFG